MLLRPLAILSVFVAFAPETSAQMHLRSQERKVEVVAQSAGPGGMPGSDSSLSTAPDNGPFSANLSATAASTLGSAWSTATQTSTLAPDRIQGSGTTNANASVAFDPGASASATGRTQMTIAFDLSDTVSYSLTGSLTIDFPDANPVVILTREGLPVFYQGPTSSFGTTPLQASGVLVPGSYQLYVYADATRGVTAFWNFGHRSSFDFDFQVAPISGTSYCFGDGSGTACPCGNDSALGDYVGCTNSLGVGGKLRVDGNPSLSNDTLVLSGSQMPNGPVLYFQGTAPQNGGAGAVFGDGKRCAGGSITRLGTKTNAAGASQYPTGADPAVSVRGQIGGPGSRVYQGWYRNSASFCTPDGFNLTNAVEVLWGA